jgi:hypothetical protein
MDTEEVNRLKLPRPRNISASTTTNRKSHQKITSCQIHEQKKRIPIAKRRRGFQSNPPRKEKRKRADQRGGVTRWGT